MVLEMGTVAKWKEVDVFSEPVDATAHDAKITATKKKLEMSSFEVGVVLKHQNHVTVKNHDSALCCRV